MEEVEGKGCDGGVWEVWFGFVMLCERSLEFGVCRGDYEGRRGGGVGGDTEVGLVNG